MFLMGQPSQDTLLCCGVTSERIFNNKQGIVFCRRSIDNSKAPVTWNCVNVVFLTYCIEFQELPTPPQVKNFEKIL